MSQECENEEVKVSNKAKMISNDQIMKRKRALSIQTTFFIKFLSFRDRDLLILDHLLTLVPHLLFKEGLHVTFV